MARFVKDRHLSVGEIVRVSQVKDGLFYLMCAYPDALKPGGFFFDGSTVHFDEADKKFRKVVEYSVVGYRRIEQKVRKSIKLRT